MRLYLAHQRTVFPRSIEKLLATGLPQISRSRDLFIGDSETGLARRQPLLCSSFKCATHPRLPSQVNHNPLQSKLLRFCIHCLGRVYQTFIARFTQLRQPHFIAIFSSRVSQNKASFLQGKRDTAHQSQSQLAFLSIEFRIAADCALDLFFCLVLLILTVRSATSSFTSAYTIKMSARLDKSLDEIISTQRRSSGRGRGRRVHRTAPAATAPAGGVKKNPKHAKGAVKNIPTGPSGSSGEGKILVTGFVSLNAALLE